MKSRKNALLFSVACICLAFCVTAFALWRDGRQVAIVYTVEGPGHESLPVLGTIPAFSLVDASGVSFESGKLDDTIWVANFIFTSCAGPCPVMSTNISELQKRFQGHGDVRFVSISVDPERDTPEVLTEYGKRYEADSERWYFLTGSTERIHNLAAKGFKVGSVDEPLFHSPRFILVDRGGHVRGYYHGTDDESVDDLERDIRVLLSESA